MQSSFPLKQQDYLENKQSFQSAMLRKLLQVALFFFASFSRCDFTANSSDDKWRIVKGVN